MNNRFKLRAFVKNLKLMVGVEAIDFRNKFIITYDGEGMDYDYNDKEIELMQCTGLKDSEGNFIFELDILNSGNEKYIVKYLDFKFVLENITNSFNYDVLHRADSFKVIGNIYENKELLTQ